MAVCGWCKRPNVKKVVVTDIIDGAVVRTGYTRLEEHTIPTSMKTTCRGFETYKDLGPSGTPGR